MWARRFRRIVIAIVIIAVTAGTSYVAFRPVRIVVLSFALVPELLEAAPRPLTAIIPDPRRISTMYGESRRDRMDIYIPQASPVELRTVERHPTLLLVLGVGPLPLDEPRVVRTATALSRLGFVVAAPESTELRRQRIGPDEPAHLVEAFETVAARPDVDPARIGIVGISIGGGLALIAAADPRIADRVAFVNAFGGYGDAPTLLAEIATRSIVVAGERRSWQPRELSRQVFLQLVLDLVGDPVTGERVRQRIEPIILGDGPTIESHDPRFAATLEGDAHAVYRLATAPNVSIAEAAIASLSADARANLARLSPNGVVERIQARIYLMHDEGDDAIPFSQLGPLVAAVPQDRLARVTAFRFFDHVAPGSLDLTTLPELWKLFEHLTEVVGEAV